MGAMGALSVGVLFGFCNILDNVKSYIIKTTITILIADPDVSILKIKGLNYGGRESSTATSENTCKQKKHHQENIFISLTAGGANAHNTNKEFYLQHVSLFGCVVSMCCQID